ncbi:MAG TPA: flagellar biosynthetic protein FliQ [Polyangiales bacterium]|nr:flagellar biosynthetic protein FliQ [Polyangiales bacterium]
MDLPSIAAEAVRLALSLALPALIAAFIVSVLLALFEVATQGQDASVSFVPRLLAVALVLYVGREFLGTELVHFTQSVVRDISLVSR